MSLFGLLLLSVWPLVTAQECSPVTWANSGDRMARTNPPEPAFTRQSFIRDEKKAAPGDVVCRYWTLTGDNVNYCTCTELADRYGMTIAKFFTLNPTVDDECSNIEPDTEYCVRGYIQPIVSPDGSCGPNHDNITCLYTEKSCCNSQTWNEDCSNGICWAGTCLGHKTYTTDGTCGYQNGNRLCAGPWGDCCNFRGECGTGEGYCSDDDCQSGNCTTPIGSPGAPSVKRLDIGKYKS